MAKNIIYMGLLVVIIIILISGCMNMAQFGAINNEKVLKGLVVTPGQCFNDVISNPLISNGNPLPHAQIYFYSGESGTLESSTITSPDGSFEVKNPLSSGYIIYAFREYPESSSQFVVLKKAVIDVTPSGKTEIGEINSYTTAQVIIWEQANLLNGQNFTSFNPQNPSWNFTPADLILPVSDVPNLVPTQKLLNAVEKALQECRDPQKDSTVIKYAKEIVKAQFGSPEPTPQPTPVIIYPTPCVAPLPDVRFSLTVDGFTVTFKNLSTNASRYVWDYGDGKKSITLASSHSHTYEAAGSYLVTLTAYNICGQSISTAQMVDNVGGIDNSGNTSEGTGINY